MASQTFTIVKASNNVDVNGTNLTLLISPLPTVVNGTSITSPYIMPYTIQNPTPNEVTAYSTFGASITLTTDK